MGELLLRGPAMRYVGLPGLPRLEVAAGRVRAGARRAAGPGLVLGSSAAIQLSSSVSAGLFRTLGALGTSSLRFAAAAVVLLAVVRPKLRRSRSEWVSIAAFGGVMAAMNVAFYQAIARIPLGTAVTVEYLGPLLVAVVGVRRLREVAWLVLAAMGVIALSAPSSPGSWIGLGFAAAAGIGEAGYVLASRAVGERSVGVEGLSLAVAVAAVLTLPFTVMAAPSVTPADGAKLVVAAALGVGLAFALEMQAIRRTSAKVVSILFSLDPGVAVVVGAVFLGQHVGLVGIAGLTCVIAAGIGVTLDTRPR
jgi:inner membrane transporter RhtA